jgi:hypothetical protein
MWILWKKFCTQCKTLYKFYVLYFSETSVSSTRLHGITYQKIVLFSRRYENLKPGKYTYTVDPYVYVNYIVLSSYPVTDGNGPIRHVETCPDFFSLQEYTQQNPLSKF